MPIKRPRILESGLPYNHLFPQASMQDITVKKGAVVEDTVALIPQVVKLKHHQISAFVNRELKGLDTYQVCKKLWEFMDKHIAYKPDTKNYEQIRTPARTWHDRFNGVDCDCYTTFISCALYCLKIPHIFRITKYDTDRFQHIYPIVPTPDGHYITMDCVVEQFNYEEPYTEKKDTPMDLQILDGLSSTSTSTTKRPYVGLDAEAILDQNEDLGELGSFIKKKLNNVGNKTILKNIVKPVAKITNAVNPQKIKAAVKQTLHTVNRVNPATLLLRNGVLASMKLNVMNVANQLRWSYLNENEVKRRGMDFSRYQKLKTVREKLEHIFHSAGGKPENLKEAILKGKGNTGNDVPLNGYYNQSYDLSGVNESTPIYTLLGNNIYYSENVQGIEGLGNLGEVTTAAALTSAAGIMAAIKTLINSIGSVFPPKGKVAETKEAEPIITNNTSSNNNPIPNEVKMPVNEPLPNIENETSPVSEPLPKVDTETQDIPNANNVSESMVADNNNAKASTKSPTKEDDSFWNKNKSWIKPTLWGVGGLALLVILYKTFNSKTEKKSNQLSGLKSKKPIKKAVVLM